MDNFALPPQQPPPPSQPGQGPVGLPPKHKIKSEAPKLEVSEIDSGSDKKIEDLSDDEFDALMQEELPVIPDKPPQCDWHLGALMSGNYPDPFSLPALRLAQHIVLHDMAAV